MCARSPYLGSSCTAKGSLRKWLRSPLAMPQRCVLWVAQPTRSKGNGDALAVLPPPRWMATRFVISHGFRCQDKSAYGDSDSYSAFSAADRTSASRW
jgi:hypothetical protein